MPSAPKPPRISKNKPGVGARAVSCRRPWVAAGGNAERPQTTANIEKQAGGRCAGAADATGAADTAGTPATTKPDERPSRPSLPPTPPLPPMPPVPPTPPAPPPPPSPMSDPAARRCRRHRPAVEQGSLVAPNARQRHPDRRRGWRHGHGRSAVARPSSKARWWPPMPGNVIRIGAEVGDTVTAGQPLCATRIATEHPRGPPSGAEHMSPDPVEHYPDLWVDAPHA